MMILTAEDAEKGRKLFSLKITSRLPGLKDVRILLNQE